MEDFDFRIPYFGQAETIDKIHDLLQRCLDDGLAAPYGAEAQDRALPEFLISAFRDRNVELIRGSDLNSFENPALALQGMILGQHEI